MNAEYTVEFVDPSYRKAKVRARIPLSGNSVMMEGGIAGAFQDGWSTFVGNLTAKDDDQKIVKLKRAGRDRWEIPEPTPQTLGLSYTVILGHDRYPDKWPFGYKQAAYGRQDYAFYTGKSLFVATPELADATISFTLPAGWKVRTGWKETSESPNKFSAQGLTELWHTGLVVGNPREKRVAVENVSSTVVSGKKMRLSVELLADTVVRLIPEAAKVFGGSPNEKVLVVVDCDSEYLHEGGEAFNRSILLMFQRPAGEENRSHWSHVLTHELIHLWIGYTIQFHDQHRVEWFLEGVTDYLTLLLQARLGMISLDGLLEGLSFNYEEYGKRAGSISLVEAGANKAKNYWLIYSGGAMVAMALDSEIRSRSENRYGWRDYCRRCTGTPLNTRPNSPLIKYTRRPPDPSRAGT